MIVINAFVAKNNGLFNKWGEKNIKLNLCLQSGDHGLPKKTPLKLLLIDDMFQKSATGNHILVFAHV